MATQALPAAVLMVLATPVPCLAAVGLYLQWHSRQIYKRIGNYSIGEGTFYGQLQYPGMNFPGPNVLEAVIAMQPADLQAHIADHRHRLCAVGVGPCYLIWVFSWRLAWCFLWFEK